MMTPTSGATTDHKPSSYIAAPQMSWQFATFRCRIGYKENHVLNKQRTSPKDNELINVFGIPIEIVILAHLKRLEMENSLT